MSVSPNNLNKNIIFWRLSLRVFFIYLLCILFTNALNAQLRYPWRTFSSSDGLAENYCFSLGIGRDGSVWIVHNESTFLSRLDGYSVNKIPMPSERIRNIYPVNRTTAWAVSQSGVWRYLANNWTPFPIREIKEEYLRRPSLNVKSPPMVVMQNKVFVLLQERLLSFDWVHGETKTELVVTNTHLHEFIDLAEDRDSSLWITGIGRIGNFKPESKQWSELNISESMTNLSISRPVIDETGGITLIGTDPDKPEKSILYFSKTQGFRSIINIPHAKLCWRDPDGSFWLMTAETIKHLSEHGEIIPDMTMFDAEYYSDAKPQVNGAFWLATSQGLARYTPPLWRRFTGGLNLTGPVKSIFEDSDGFLWCLTDNCIWRWDRTNNLTKINLPLDFPIFSAEYQWFTETPTKTHIILSNKEGAWSINKETLTFENISTISNLLLRPLFVLKDGGILFQNINSQTNLDLITYDGNAFSRMFTIKIWLQKPINVFTGVQQLDNSLILATENELLHITPNGNITTISSNLPITEPIQTCLLLPNNKLWVATSRKIFEFNDGQWKTVRSGFDKIHSISSSLDGSVWVCSANEISWYRDGIWINHGFNEGLFGEPMYMVLKDRSGKLWCATSKGLFLYNPEADNDYPIAKIIIDQLPLTPKLDQPLIIVFQGEDRWKATPPEQLLFSWHIDEMPWTPFARVSVASLQNLLPGTHRFEVVAMDRNWNRQLIPESLEFTVILPWYREPRIILITAIGVLSAFILAIIAIIKHIQLKRSYADIERKVEERTKELKEAQEVLLQTHKMRALGTMAAGIAHDFNNILSIIRGSAQIIENNLTDTEKIKNRVDRIKTVVDQGSAIVRALLGFSQTQGAAMTVCDVHEVIESAIQIISDRYLDKIKTVFQFDESIPTVLANPDILQQMIINICINAAEAMPQGGVLTISTSLMSKPPANSYVHPAAAEQYVYISIKDTGTGIPADYINRIFEPFFTTKALSTKRGTGLGLTMVYEFAKAQGFGLSVQSEVGKGTEFFIVIPSKKIEKS